MDDSNELNLSNSGDENKTILLDETIDKPNESTEQDVNKESTSTGSLKAVDISELINEINDEPINLKPNNSDDLLSVSQDTNSLPTNPTPKETDKSNRNDDDEPIVRDDYEDDDRILEIARIKNPNEIDEDVR